MKVQFKPKFRIYTNDRMNYLRLDRIALILIFMIVIWLVGSISIQAYKNHKYKYAIESSHGRWEVSDYTDTFQIQSGSVKYIDSHGNEVIRYGTFAIKLNK